MPKLITNKQYTKSAGKFLKKNPHLVRQYYKTLLLLETNPSHPSLRLHKLKGNLSEFYSVSINAAYRIMLYFIMIEDTIMLVSIGTHDEVY
ncbi:MAG TPA: plasmid stabilization protein [Lentisphaeria bacterium]|nr:MAG: plasmid stabilization protein [Lentisphaerae bacterium GWF2_38_69]HBM15821.1 plasmid stabilization protein [Lentisphaeria bacterium]